MKERELDIDRTCHVIYSRKCRKTILARLRQHYPVDKVDIIFEKIQHQYEQYLREYSRKDLGGKKNFHNGTGGTYDCIMLVCYYVVCRDVSSFDEIAKMTEEITVSTFKGLGFVNIGKPFMKKLMYRAFQGAEKKCCRWHDFEMELSPYSADEPLNYRFTRCPFADFIHQFGLEEIAGALCNVDYASMRAMNTVLVRKHTCIESDHCDYAFYAPDDPALEEHQEYIDDDGFIRNR